MDASKSAYGAIAYICKGKISSFFIAKNRVAPLKEITLPKLELMAAVVGACIGNQLRQNLGIQRTVFWSDSQIVLHWLSSSKSLGKFAKNRINEIKDLTQGCVWKYVPTNPADLQTRGISSTQFKNSSLWNHGPAWITDESSSHRTTESNTLIGYITLAIDSNRGKIELSSIYPHFPVKPQLILFWLHV